MHKVGGITSKTSHISFNHRMGWRSMGRKTFSLFAAFCVFFTISFSTPSLALKGLIRDAETEKLIKDYAHPIFRAARVGSQNIKIHIIGDSSFNAFVVDGQNMFIHVGALMKTKSPNQLIGIIAHETGHIAGGHLAGLRRQISKTRGTALLCHVLGILATTAAAASGQGGNVTGLGTAAIGGCGAFIQRTILSYRRAHESAADQAALSYLNATKQSGQGMIETFEFFADQGLATLKYADPYAQSHPMPRQRIAQLKRLARNSPYFRKKDPAALQLRHDMMRAKIIGYMVRPHTVFNRFPKSDQSLPAQYARAIAHYHLGNLKSAIKGLDRLIRAQPGNPYLYEIKGQFLFEKGRARESIPFLRKALKLAPREQLIRILLADALLATGEKRYLTEVIRMLRKALVYENTSATGYRLLARAYGIKGKIPEARLASAHRYLFEGRLDNAKQQARWAIKSFKKGSAAWIQADDIINYQASR